MQYVIILVGLSVLGSQPLENLSKFSWMSAAEIYEITLVCRNIWLFLFLKDQSYLLIERTLILLWKYMSLMNASRWVLHLSEYNPICRTRLATANAAAASASSTAGTTAANTSMELDLPVDPNEPTYCFCNQVSYGEMVACDNPDVSKQTPPRLLSPRYLTFDLEMTKFAALMCSAR